MTHLCRALWVGSCFLEYLGDTEIAPLESRRLVRTVYTPGASNSCTRYTEFFFFASRLRV